MAIQTFTSGQTLTSAQMTSLQANDYNWTVSAKTASYILVAADKGTTITMSNASATTITVNTGLFSAGDTLRIFNIGAGTCTVTAGTCTVTTSGSLALAQWGGGTLYFTSASAAIFFPFGGVNYGVATGGTDLGTRTVSGINYKVLEFTATGTLTVTNAGLFDILLVGGGGGGYAISLYGAGGGAGGVLQQTVYLSANATITVGGGGTASSSLALGGESAIGSTNNGIVVVGGGCMDGGIDRGVLGASTAGGRGGGTTLPGNGILNQGNRGGAGAGNSTAAGGGGGAGAVGSAGSGTTGGAGGAGYDVSTFIGGSSLFKAGGGGGSGSVTGGTGGSSVGGNGGTSGTNGAAAAANTGSGGGGAVTANTAGAGGSGIVYVRFRI